jgi:aminocarboxymuconate-semialdehyde decarboxylase
MIGAVGAGVCCGSTPVLGAAPGDGRVVGGGAGATPGKIDIYNHVMPAPYLDLVRKNYKDQGMVKRMTEIRILWDMEARAAMLEQWPEVQQVLTLGNPPPDALFGPEESPAAARVANDGMAEICAKWPKKFPVFVAALPMNNVPAALKEMDRAIGTLGARGIEIKTNVNGRPMDDPEFFPVFERATNHHGVPIWMHPIRPATFTDYKAEPKSRYEIWQVMGWPYETTAAMARMVFSGMLDRLPDMKIITHHCGGMLPFFAGRAETLWVQIGSRTADEDYSGILKGLKRPFMEYFKSFYGDTVLGGSASALRCGLDFFGPDHVVFASDCPFDPEGGPMFIREGIRSIESLNLPEAVKRKIYLENAQRLLVSTKKAAMGNVPG